MKRIARTLTSILLVALTAAPLSAQAWAGRGRLQGTVVDPDGKPYKGAKVELHPESDPADGPKALETDKKGRWSYLGLKGGTWTVVITTDEYLISEGTIRVSEASANKPVHIELTAPEPEPAQAQAVNYVGIGNELMKAGKYAEARAQFEQAMVDIDPANRAVLERGIAQTYSQEGNHEQAAAMLEQALASAPEDVNTLKLMISVLLAAGRDDDAKVYIARLPESEKLDASTRLNMGIEHYNVGELDAALEHFEKAVQDFPDNPDAYYYRGLTYLGQTKNDLALADLLKMLEIAPNSPKAAEAQEFVDYLKTP